MTKRIKQTGTSDELPSVAEIKKWLRDRFIGAVMFYESSSMTVKIPLLIGICVIIPKPIDLLFVWQVLKDGYKEARADSERLRREAVGLTSRELCELMTPFNECHRQARREEFPAPWPQKAVFKPPEIL